MGDNMHELLPEGLHLYKRQNNHKPMHTPEAPIHLFTDEFQTWHSKDLLNHVKYNHVTMTCCAT